MARITWRKQPNKRGLAHIAQHPRGYGLRVGGVEVATVAAYDRDGERWYWVARDDDLGIPWRNTAAEKRTYADIEEAKRECREYVVSCLRGNEDA